MTLPDPDEPIQGPRLRLRPITPDDLPALLRWLSDPEVMAFYGRPPSTLAEARGEFLEPSSLPCWRFIIEADGRAIGEIQYSFSYADVTWSAGIDIFIGEPAARDRGLGTEAIRTVLQYLFETKGVSRVVIDPEPSNRRAIRAYEKAGFRLDGVIRRHTNGPPRRPAGSRPRMKIDDDRWADAAFMTILPTSPTTNGLPRRPAGSRPPVPRETHPPILLQLTSRPSRKPPHADAHL